MAVVILDQMQMLDQQIALARPVGEKRAHLIQRGRIDLAALGRTRALAAAAFAGAGGARLGLLGNAHFSLFLSNKDTFRPRISKPSPVIAR